MKLKEFLPVAAAIAFFALNAHAQTPAQLQAEIAVLKAQVTALQNQTNTTVTQAAAIQRQVNQIIVNPALAMGPYVSVNYNPSGGLPGPNIVFHGANLYINNGTGATSNTNGLGNLFIGYNEPSQLGLTPAGWMGSSDRFGSHNLVIGRFNKYPAITFGSIIAGEMNEVVGEGGAVLSGNGNIAYSASAVVGGLGNTASDTSVVVSGGENRAQTAGSCIVGGYYNSTGPSAYSSVIVGGTNQTATTELQVVQ
jgi:hypothetical protein